MRYNANCFQVVSAVPLPWAAGLDAPGSRAQVSREGASDDVRTDEPPGNLVASVPCERRRTKHKRGEMESPPYQ
jgi:hypothetical protein